MGESIAPALRTLLDKKQIRKSRISPEMVKKEPGRGSA